VVNSPNCKDANSQSWGRSAVVADASQLRERNVAHYPFFAALIFAQRARCAAAILFLPATDILRVGRAVLFRVGLVPVVLVPSNNRTT
jgi:hypothetical protein